MQLAAAARIAQLSSALKAGRLDDVRSVELAENRDCSERVFLVELAADGRRTVLPEALAHVEGATGTAIARAGRTLHIHGAQTVADTLNLATGDGPSAILRLERHVSGFFQGNRHLLEPMVQRVLAQLPAGPLLDLYAGTGLFGLAHVAAGRGDVIAVEGDVVSASDLRRNAEPFGRLVATRLEAVEETLRTTHIVEGRSVLVDPPRVGLSKAVVAALTAARPRCLVYVSCDVATLARDVARLAAGGYRLTHAEIFDLFPGTAHVESLVVLEISG